MIKISFINGMEGIFCCPFMFFLLYCLSVRQRRSCGIALIGILLLRLRLRLRWLSVRFVNHSFHLCMYNFWRYFILSDSHTLLLIWVIYLYFPLHFKTICERARSRIMLSNGCDVNWWLQQTPTVVPIMFVSVLVFCFCIGT